MIPSIYSLFVLGAILTCVLTPLVRYLALQKGFVDCPQRARKVHQQATPRLGGAAILMSFLIVSAIEKRSCKKAEIEVIPFHGLTQFEIERIMEDSFEHAVDDFNERQLIEFRQTAERVFRGIEQCWDVAENDLPETSRDEIQKQMDVVRQSMKGQDSQALKTQLDVLGDLTRPLADNSMGRSILSELQDDANLNQ